MGLGFGLALRLSLPRVDACHSVDAVPYPLGSNAGGQLVFLQARI